MACWILKTEPSTYPYSQLAVDKKTEWSGIRNYQARLNLRAMKRGDRALIFHTGDEKAFVGLATIVSAPHADSTAPKEDWTSVDIAAVKPLKQPLSLKDAKAAKSLKDMKMFKQSRLSVASVTDAEFKALLKLCKTAP